MNYKQYRMVEKSITRTDISAFEKEAVLWKPRLIEGAVGGIVGGVYGGITSDKKNKKEDILKGALIGGGAGLVGSKAIRTARKTLVKNTATAKDVPKVFYHGTPSTNVEGIKSKGLLGNKAFSSGIQRSDDLKKFDKHVFLSKDPTYAETYGKYNPHKADPVLVRVVLPKKKLKKITKIQNGRHILDMDPVGIGSEYVAEGNISPKFLAFSAKDADKLRAKMINKAVKRRVKAKKKSIDRSIFGVFGNNA